MTVRGSGLGLSYRGRVALTGVDLEVAPGEIVGILGPNGAGKSSLLKLLCTALRPTAGTLRLFDEAVSYQLSAVSKLRRRLGIVPDGPVHAEALTGRENAMLFARLAGLGPEQANARTHELLHPLLGADADRPVAEYSLGMRRRLALAQALAHQPALLLLDEPTTGLDLQGREQLRTLLREAAGRGAAVVVASNDVGELERLCGRVILLHQGTVRLSGVPADLIAQLGGTTSFELQLTSASAPTLKVDGVTIASATAERVVAHSQNGSSPLPALCAAVLATGARIEAVQVRRPDLSDVFLRATGAELS